MLDDDSFVPFATNQRCKDATLTSLRRLTGAHDEAEGHRALSPTTNPTATQCAFLLLLLVGVSSANWGAHPGRECLPRVPALVPPPNNCRLRVLQCQFPRPAAHLLSDREDVGDDRQLLLLVGRMVS